MKEDKKLKWDVRQKTTGAEGKKMDPFLRGQMDDIYDLQKDLRDKVEALNSFPDGGLTFFFGIFPWIKIGSEGQEDKIEQAGAGFISYGSALEREILIKRLADLFVETPRTLGFWVSLRREVETRLDQEKGRLASLMAEDFLAKEGIFPAKFPPKKKGGDHGRK